MTDDDENEGVHVTVSVDKVDHVVVLTIDGVATYMPADVADRIGRGILQAVRIVRNQMPCQCDNCKQLLFTMN